MTKEEKLDKLEQTGKDYIKEEINKLEKEYDFLTDILNNSGNSNLEDQNASKAAELFVKSIKEFLSS